METRKIKISRLHINKGQIPGLPSNPRQWTKDEMERLKKSITETPELLEARGAIVYPWGGEYIVLGGNMRLSAAKELGRKCRMMELDPHYCDVIIARWEKLTGKKAEKIG